MVHAIEGSKGMKDCSRVWVAGITAKSVCPFNGLECQYVACCDAVFELWLIRNGVVACDSDKMSCFRDLRGRN